MTDEPRSGQARPAGGGAPAPVGDDQARPAGGGAPAPVGDDQARPAGGGGTPDWRLAAAVASVLAGWLLFSARQLLNPFIVTCFLLFVLAPYRHASWARRLMIVGGVIGVLWLVDLLGAALAPFVIALAVAYFLDPAVDRLEARGLGRSLSILVLTIPVFAAIVGLVLLVVPPLLREIATFVRHLPGLVDTAVGAVQPLLERFGPIDLDQVVSEQLPGLLDPLNALVARLGSGAVGVGRSVGAGVGFGLRFISFLVVTPLATFYTLRDIDRLRDEVQQLIPAGSRALVVLGEIDVLLGRWLRGQLIVCSLLGLFTWLGLRLFGVPYALLLGILTGALNIVPLVGFWIAFVPVLLVSLTMPEPLFSLLKIAVFYLVIQAIEGNLLSPRIVGNEVGLNPVLMILALVVFSALLGFVGVLVAVPAAAILALLYRRWRDGRRALRGTAGTASPPAAGA